MLLLIQTQRLAEGLLQLVLNQLWLRTAQNQHWNHFGGIETGVGIADKTEQTLEPRYREEGIHRPREHCWTET